MATENAPRLALLYLKIYILWDGKERERDRREHWNRRKRMKRKRAEIYTEKGNKWEARKRTVRVDMLLMWRKTCATSPSKRDDNIHTYTHTYL